MAPKKAKSKNDKAHKAAVSATTAAAAVTASTQQKPSPVGKSEQVAGRSLGERVTSANRQAAEVVNADTEEEEVEPFTFTPAGPLPWWKRSHAPSDGSRMTTGPWHSAPSTTARRSKGARRSLLTA